MLVFDLVDEGRYNEYSTYNIKCKLLLNGVSYSQLDILGLSFFLIVYHIVNLTY